MKINIAMYRKSKSIFYINGTRLKFSDDKVVLGDFLRTVAVFDKNDFHIRIMPNHLWYKVVEIYDSQKSFVCLLFKRDFKKFMNYIEMQENKNLEVSDKSVSARPDWETIVRIMKDKSLDCFDDEIINVIYSKDNTMRYVILKNKDAILTYHLENLYPYDDEDWKYISAVEGTLPAMWETQSDWCSRFAREDDLMRALVNEPEYKQFFL